MTKTELILLKTLVEKLLAECEALTAPPVSEVEKVEGYILNRLRNANRWVSRIELLTRPLHNSSRRAGSGEGNCRRGFTGTPRRT